MVFYRVLLGLADKVFMKDFLNIVGSEGPSRVADSLLPFSTSSKMSFVKRMDF